MSKCSRVPEPVYIEECVSGTLAKLADVTACALYIGVEPPADTNVVARGALVTRYAIPLIVPPTEAIVPGLFISERGGMLTGRECWDYLQMRFQLHPRADVIGLTLNGASAQVLVRELDFGAAVRILAYTASPDVRPLAEVMTLHTADAMIDRLPELLKRYLPRS